MTETEKAALDYEGENRHNHDSGGVSVAKLFTDGFLAGVAYERERAKGLEIEIEVLLKETEGFIKCHELALSMDFGNSNMNVMAYRIANVRNALEKWRQHDSK